MKIATIFGGTTRFATIEALADTKKPITAYQIAMTKGLDPAATYRCLIELLDIRIVESRIGKRNQTFYRLSDGPGQAAANFLRSLKQKTPQIVDLEEWASTKMQAVRMGKIVRLDKSTLREPDETQDVKSIMSKRIPGELSSLITSSEMAFNELFKQKGNVFILKA